MYLKKAWSRSHLPTWMGYRSIANVSANFILILLETLFADFQDKKVHFIGTTTVAIESIFHF